MKQRACRSSGPPSWRPACSRCWSSRSSTPATCTGSADRRSSWSAQAVYTVTFLIFWGAISTAGAVSALLAVESDALNAADARRPTPADPSNPSR